MNLYRCHNPKCGSHEFEADVPVCPKCTVDARNPRYAHVIVQRSVIHFDPPDPLVQGMGLNTLFCDPTKTVFKAASQGQNSSGVPAAVNCVKCRAKEGFPPNDWTPDMPNWVFGPTGFVPA